MHALVLLRRSRHAPTAAPMAKSAAAAVGPEVGQRIVFLSDSLTDKGPATGEIVLVKTTVDGLYVVVKFADGQRTLSWDDLEEGGADVRGGVWMVKSHPAIFPGPSSREQAEAGNYKKRRVSWFGLWIRVENEAGTVREGAGWQTRMLYPYGEVEGSEGVDGDRVDCYLGPYLEDATHVYVVHQRRVGRWDQYDEDKCMLGFLSEEEAAIAYLQHYDDPRFLGPITALPVAEFVAKVRATRGAPAMVKGTWFGDADLLKATQKKMITVPGYTKHDGTFVAPHQKLVHYNPDHSFSAIAQGGVSHSQKEAHKKLAKQDWFAKLMLDDQALHVMSLATEIQDAASASAAVTGWKAAAKAGKNPSGAQWAAFNGLAKDKQAALYDEAKKAAGSLSHLAPPKAEPAPAAAAPDPLSQWKAFSAKHWDKNDVVDFDSIKPFLKTPEAGVAALMAYSQGAFHELNQAPDSSEAKALLAFVDALPAANVAKLHRVLAFASDADAKSFVDSLGKPQPRTLTSWTTGDPAAPGQTPMNNIALDLASQFGEHRVFLTVDGAVGAKDISFAYSKDGGGKPGLDLVLPKGTKMHVVGMHAVGQDIHVQLSGKAAALPLSDVPAWDYLAKQANSGAVGTAKDMEQAAQVWLDANPGKVNELSLALQDLAMEHVAASMDLPAPDSDEPDQPLPPGHSAPTDADVSAMEAKQKANEQEEIDGDGYGKLTVDGLPDGWQQGFVENSLMLPADTSASGNHGMSIYANGDGTYKVQMVNLHGVATSTFPSLSALDAASKTTHMSIGASLALTASQIEAAIGPKEGDTKPGANGDLVFHDGRWHKQDGGEDAGAVKQMKAMADAAYSDGVHAVLEGIISADTTPPSAVEHAQNLLDNLKAKDALQQIPKSGSFYQKEAFKELKDDAGFKNNGPASQLALVMDLYKKKQGAASQSAALSLWKKALLAGKVPSPAQQQAIVTLAKQDHQKAAALVASVGAAIGLEQVSQLLQQANANLEKQGVKKPDAFVQPVAKPPAPKPAPAGLGDLLALAKTHGLLGGAAVKAAIDLAEKGDLATLKAAKANLPPMKKNMHAFLSALIFKMMDAQKESAAPAADALPASWVQHPMMASFTAPDGTKITVQVASTLKHLIVIQNSASGGSPLYHEGGLFLAPAVKLIGSLTKQPISPAIEKALWTMLDEADKPDAPAPNQTFTPVKPAAAAPSTMTAPKYIYTNTTDGHNKQWSVYTAGNTLVTEYGPIGKTQQKTTKTFASADAAYAAANKLMKEKKAGGYEQQKVDYGHKVAAPSSAPVKPVITPGTTFAAAATKVQKMIAEGNAGEIENELQLAWGLTSANAVAFQNYALAAMVSMGANKPEFVSDEQWAAGSIDAGPKDGDIKHGADGDLVFKNGRWHKLGAGKKKALPTPMQIDAVIAATAGKVSAVYKLKIAAAKKAALAGDVEGVKALLSLPMVQQTTKTKGAIEGIYKLLTGEDASGASIAAAPPIPTTAPPDSSTVVPKMAPSPAAKPGAPSPMQGWAQTGPQAGSNPGGKFKDKAGQEWYVKFPKSTDIAKNELLAAKFYQMLGMNVPFLKLVEKDGKVGIASKWNPGVKKASAAALAGAEGAHEGFVFDAWLANWDAVGPDFMNMQVAGGKAVRVDVGGALVYRAQGGKKTDFGESVPELESLLNASTNAATAAVFKGMSKKALDAGLQKLNMLKPSQIEELCEKIGPGSAAERKQLAATLIARRAFILKKYGVADQWAAVKAMDPTKLPVKDKDLPKPLDYFTMKDGKGKSSKAWKNAQNNKVSADLIAFAAKGNLVALKDYQYAEITDNEAGTPTGKMKSIVDHPSKEIQEQWVGLVELLQSIATPSIPTLEMPSMGAVSALDEISDFVGSFSPTERPETVATEHRMGFFMALGQIEDIHGLLAGAKWSFIQKGGAWTQKMKAGFASLSALTRSYISSVQSSGSINHAWSQGKTQAASAPLQKLTAEIYKSAVDIPEGTVLRRGMSDTTAGKIMSKQLLAAKPGLVIQNTDSMCTSFNETHSWGGDVQMTIRCAKGCKVTPSFASGSYTGEYEITTLPGQRYVVLSVEKTGSGVKLEVLMLPPHEGFVAEVGKLAKMGKALQSVLLIIRRWF